MANFLNIGSFTNVPVAFDSASRGAVERLGFGGRAYGGNYRTAVKVEKRSWKFRTDWMLDATAVTLEGVLANGAVVSCSGDFIGATVNCIGLVGEGPILNAGTTDGKGFMRALNITLIEV
jgi:hypothetical protein